MYKITLSNGYILDDIHLNGSTFISYKPIDETIFDHNLSPVDIERIGEPSPIELIDPTGHHENMTYTIFPNYPEGEWWFALSDISESEMRYAKICSQIEYMSMMTGVEL